MINFVAVATEPETRKPDGEVMIELRDLALTLEAAKEVQTHIMLSKNLAFYHNEDNSFFSFKYCGVEVICNVSQFLQENTLQVEGIKNSFSNFKFSYWSDGVRLELSQLLEKRIRIDGKDYKLVPVEA
jgi:hypothetical protein